MENHDDSVSPPIHHGRDREPSPDHLTWNREEFPAQVPEVGSD
jgi:hypothetical protein